MKKIIFLSLFLLLFSGLRTEPDLSPAVKAVQEDLVQHYEDIGYGDYEIDLLHRKIGLLLPKLSNFIETDENGEKFVKITVTMGQSKRTTGENYLINGYARLYPGAENTLKKLEVTYLRQNTVGDKFQVEKRVLINPTPNFLGNNKVDSNMDISLSLYLTQKTDNDFKLIREVTFKDIDLHHRKKRLLDSYKQYLRKTLKALERQIRFIELSDATEFLFMLEFE